MHLHQPSSSGIFGDHQEFPQTDTDRSVHLPDARLEGGRFIKDAHASMFAVQPSTRALVSRETVFETGITTTESGTGFGLAICEQIADAHGWSVSVTESDAGGARFEFTGVDVSEA